MDVRNVYVIFDITKYSKEQIIGEFVSERYRHNFMFDNMVFPDAVIKDYMDKSDEIWCFGNCEDMRAYKIAIEKGADIWNMG